MGGAAGRAAGSLQVRVEGRRRRGDRGGGREACGSGLAAAPDDRQTGEGLRQLGLAECFEGRLVGAEGRFEQAQELAVRVGDQRGAGWALQHLAWSATTRGDYELAMSALERAAGVFAGLEDTGGLAWVAGTAGFVRLLQGRFAGAR